MLKYTTIMTLLLVTGCTSIEPVYVPTYPNIPKDLLEPCKELNEITKGDGKTLAPWIVETVTKYKECSNNKQALVEIVKRPN